MILISFFQVATPFPSLLHKYNSQLASSLNFIPKLFQFMKIELNWVIFLFKFEEVSLCFIIFMYTYCWKPFIEFIPNCRSTVHIVRTITNVIGNGIQNPCYDHVIHTFLMQKKKKELSAGAIKSKLMITNLFLTDRSICIDSFQEA